MADSRDIIRTSTRLSPESDRRDARQAQSPWRDDAHAVVIGINEYLDPKIPDLRFARADAEAIYGVLTDSTVGRFKPENVTLLLDAQATERNIRSALGTQLPRRAGADSTVLIYFAGHGAPVIDPRARSADGLEKYLIPHDAIADDLRASGIAMETVQQYFSWLDASQVICFLDSCYSGTAGGRSFDHPAYQTRAMLSDEFLDSLASEGRFVVTACGANEVSLESPECGHGIFTRHLVEGLRGAADADENGKVTIDELYEYVYRNVEHDARVLGGSMKPVKKGSVRGTVYLTEYETPAKRRVREALRFAAEAWTRGEVPPAVALWHEVLTLEPQHEEATRRLAEVAELERKRAAEIKRKEKALLPHVKSGTLSMREYNRALTLLDTEPGSLGADDVQRRRFLDSLIAGELTIRTYVRSVELLDTHTGEHSPDGVAPSAVASPAAAPRVPAPPNDRRPAARPVGDYPVPSPVPPSPATVPGQGPALAGAGRAKLYAIAGGLAVGVAALVITWNVIRPDDDSSDRNRRDTTTVVPAPVPFSALSSPPPQAPDSAARKDTAAPKGAQVRTLDTTRKAPSAPTQRTLANVPPNVERERAMAAASSPRVVPEPVAAAASPDRSQPLSVVSMVEPRQTANVPVGAPIRLQFPELEPGDRISIAEMAGRGIRVTDDRGAVSWRISAAGETILVNIDGDVREFNTRYTVTVNAGVRSERGRVLATPATFTFTTVFWDPRFYYRLTTEGRGANEVLSANPSCGVEAPDASGAQDWYFTSEQNGEYHSLRNAARGDRMTLEGALPPDQCIMQSVADLPTGMLWKAVPSGRPGRFFLRNQNFREARSLTLATVDGKVVGLMNVTNPNDPNQHWTFMRSRRR
jgi:uncharacterized caspase-like protein